MPAVGITDGPPTCARDHRAVVLSCPHPARRWAALECHSAWLVVDAQVLVCSRQIHSPSQWPHTHSASALTAALIRDCNPGIPGFPNPEIPGLSRTQSQDFGINKIYLFNGLFSTFFKNNIVHLLILWCVSQSPVRRGGGRRARADMHVFVCFFTNWTANDIVDYVRLPVIVRLLRLAQECKNRPTFVWNTYRIV